MSFRLLGTPAEAIPAITALHQKSSPPGNRRFQTRQDSQRNTASVMKARNSELVSKRESFRRYIARKPASRSALQHGLAMLIIVQVFLCSASIGKTSRPRCSFSTWRSAKFIWWNNDSSKSRQTAGRIELNDAMCFWWVNTVSVQRQIAI